MRNTYNRTAIFVFYDKDGIVDDYKLYYLKKLSKMCTRVLIIVNGKISKDGLTKLGSFGDGSSNASTHTSR